MTAKPKNENDVQPTEAEVQPTVSRVTVDGSNTVVNTEVAAEAANEETLVAFTNPDSGKVETLPYSEYIELRDEKGW